MVERLHGRLGADIRRRADRMHRAGDRRDVILTHALLSFVLGRHGLADAPLARSPEGRPYLARDGPVPGFNLTHTAGLVACALSWTCRVGIDAEHLGRGDDARTMAEECLTDNELSHLRQSKAPDRSFLDF
ncbi:4'-phosphopantetheinyl transferase family protein [Muricoccus aerilatus]|uniref:4'-phosphopantetheinyl transferase family protein n=1 Tax=Muricoccus aerilatus TaxID=452982 RepID=UPI0012EB67C3|nr:4'-phosphopantetheinyl transferase family protein [Roseomonas aerilata]